MTGETPPAWLGDTGGTPREPMPLWPDRHQPARAEARIDKIDWWTDDEPLAHHGASLAPLGVVAVTGRRPMRPPDSPNRVRRPARGAGSAGGLVALVLLALLAAFFAWVTAEPLWLAVGHSTPGTVTVTRCADDGAGHGIDRRCVGTFTGTTFTRAAVQVLGDVPDPGTTAPASMTSARGGHAYVDVDTFSRAAVGVVLIMLCGLGIVRATGVRRLESRPARTVATLLSLAGPATLLTGMLITTY
jgi:hypothetical protein